MNDGSEHPRASRNEALTYIMDMLEQLAGLAERAGDKDLAIRIRDLDQADEALRVALAG